MILILSGPPGAGKGTQANLLMERSGFLKISTGDLLREHVRKSTEIGREAKVYMDRGDLVPDEILLRLVKTATVEVEPERTIVLDGYPRTVAQAEALESLNHRVLGFLNLEVDSADLIKRLSARRVCGQCGWTCHLEDAPPKVAGLCDKCTGELIQRTDDKAESIRNRLEVFQKKTAPLVDFYKSRKLHIGVQGSGKPEIVYGRLMRSLEDLGLEVNRKIV